MANGQPAQPRGQRGSGSLRGKDDSSQSGNGAPLLIIVPWLMFVMIFLPFTFLYHFYPVAIWCCVLAWCMMSFLFMLMDCRDRMGGQWYLFLGMLSFIACLSASLAGEYNYHTNMFQYYSYDESRAYTNVLPSEPAGAHGDAGKITFSNTARVDTTRAAGFKQGSTYCVAPILDETQHDRVQFWAAGLDCCPSRGDFACDDAWNPLAKSGVVILDSEGLFPNKRDNYMKATKQAAAAFGFETSDEAVLVRWVTDPQVIQDSYWTAGLDFMLALTFLYLAISIAAGVILHMFSKNVARASGANVDSINDSI